MELTEQQIQRYSRQIILSDVGGKGQMKLSKAKVLLIGAGGLGSPAGLYLAAAGVGTIGLVDGDVIKTSTATIFFRWYPSSTWCWTDPTTLRRVFS